MHWSWRAESAAAELEQLLAPLRRRLWWQQGAQLVLRTLCFALTALLVLAALAVGGLAPAPGAGLLLAMLAPLPVALAIALLRPPSLLATARCIDRYARLDERVGTAVELVCARASHPAARAQLADATARLRQLRPAEAVPLEGVRSDLLLTGGLALVSAGMVLLAGLADGVPGGLIPVRRLLDTAVALVNPPREEPRAPAPGRSQLDARLAPLLQQLEALRTNAAGLSPEELAAQRAAAAQQLAELASASRAQQEALAELARALQGTAAGREVAEYLLQGEYARAGEALTTLGRENDQLSLAGRRQLAEALRQAQSAVQPLSPALAQHIQRASAALSSRDYQRTARALGELGEAVAQAGRGVIAQSDLGALGEALSAQGEDIDAALAALGMLGTSGAGGTDRGAQGALGSGPPGTAPGTAPDAQAARLGVPGVPLPLESLPSLDGPPSSAPPDPDRPSVLAPLSLGTTTGTGAVQGGDPIYAPGETAPVPPERREVVRGYFGAGGGR
jgi:tetratricopeptide (TPR) repeat protein